MTKYITPSIEISEFKGEDIITASVSAALKSWADENNNNGKPSVTAEVNYNELSDFLN